MTDVDPDFYVTPAESNYRLLWAATLAQLVRDGRCYWQNGYCPSVDQEQAFDDLVRCGPMTRHVCRWLDVEPGEVSKLFVRWCESN